MRVDDQDDAVDLHQLDGRDRTGSQAAPTSVRIVSSESYDDDMRAEHITDSRCLRARAQSLSKPNLFTNGKQNRGPQKRPAADPTLILW